MQYGNKDKRGQATLFIIIAVVVVAIILIVIFLQPEFREKLPETDIMEVKSYIEPCLETKTNDAILYILGKGGYCVLADIESISFLGEYTAYYFKDNKNLVPTSTMMEQELNTCLQDEVLDCFISPVIAGYEIENKKCSVSSLIGEAVSVEFNCPITIKKDELTSRIESFSVGVDAPIAKLLNVSNEIITDYSQKRHVCIDCFDSVGCVNNVTITAVPVTKEVFEPAHMWLLVTDKNKKIEDKNITLRFVVEI